MNQICDLYSAKPFNASELKFLRIFDKNFQYEENKMYQGFLGLNIHRVRIASMLSNMRYLLKDGVYVYSIPVDYRDSRLISKESAFSLAQKYCENYLDGYHPVFSKFDSSNLNPIYWSFNIACHLSDVEEEKSDGAIIVDRLDGHIWDEMEMEIYQYDYNNNF